MATCSRLGLVASSDYPWKKQYRSDDSPPRAPGPTLEPIFSLLFIEYLPTSHTDKLFGWLFKGSIKSLFWQGWYLSSFPLQAPDATKTPLLALVSVSEDHRGWRDWTHDSASLTPGGSSLRRESHATQPCGRLSALHNGGHRSLSPGRPAHYSTHKASHSYPVPK